MSETALDLPWTLHDFEEEFTFKNVQLFKNETLGTGSYGAVCKAKCDQLICAAKLLYPVLFQMQILTPSKDHHQPVRRFEHECQFLRRINHPNIVQYLGTYRDAETNAPVLLMELMDESLTHFLESSPGDLPYHTQVNLSYDIAQALAFLHSNGIIHRDLSSNNVLLNADRRAKVTDFGMSTLTDGIVQMATMTMCPGTPAYMSPEALNEPPVYTENLDNFSLGVLLVQIVTRIFPKPTDRFEVVHIPSPRNPTRTVEAKVSIPETERRQAHINLIDPAHPLLPIALHCLKDWDLERPSSQQLCQTLDNLKDTAFYEGSCQQDELQLLRNQIGAKDEQLHAKDELLRAKEEQLQYTSQLIHKSQQREIIKLTEKLDSAARHIQALRLNNLELQSELELKNKQLKQCRHVLDSHELIAAKLQEATTEKERVTEEIDEIQHLSSLLYQVPTQDDADSTLEVNSQSDTSIPVDLVVGSSTVVGSNAYFRSLGSKHIRQFDSTNNRWTRLSTHPLDSCTITNVNDVLTSVGGRLGPNFSDKLYSYIDKQWIEHLPPMATKCQTPAAVASKNTLVVAGGYNRSILTTVQTLNLATKQWSHVSCLPFSTEQPSAAICGECVYIHAGYASSEQDKYSVLKCSLNELVESAPSSDVWDRIASLPVRGSSLLTVDGHIMAVGGLDSKKNRTKDVYQYSEATNSWVVASHMEVTLSFGLTACLPGNMLMVVGGYFTNQTIQAITNTC